MPFDPKVLALGIGLGAGTCMIAMLLWSCLYPERRIWPPQHATTTIKFLVWFMTTVIFATAFLLGLFDWNQLGWPASVRWMIGLSLILMGNLVVWLGVYKIGMAATSGEAAGLATSGLYRWSRNPQYMADMAILIGWGILSASVWALPVIAVGLLVLAIAPFAEEPWLEKVYGKQYREYKQTVRRYL